MRFTYALYLEMSLDKLLPGFFEAISQYEYARNVDRGALIYRREFARIELEGAQECDEPRMRQVAEAAAERLILVADVQLIEGRPDWRDYGRVTVSLVENAPNPKWTHGMGGSNPAVICGRCGKPMVSRSGRNGQPFYGCTDYPVCKGTRQISQ